MTLLPRIAEQAPCRFAGAEPPVSTYSLAPIGTRIRPICSVGVVGVRPISTDPATYKPVYPSPISAAPHCDHVSTTSKQSGDHPAPTPPVGTVSPKAQCSCVDAASVAPSTNSGNFSVLALFGVVILLLWFFAGASLRRFV